MVDRIERETLAAEYGFALEFMRSDPELSKLFRQAVAGSWDANRFIAKLRNTDWFQTHSASVRNAILQQTADPKTYQASVNQMFATVRDTYGSMFGTAMADPKQLRAWAETAHRMGWSEAQLRDRLTNTMNFRKLMRQRQMGGAASQTEQQIQSLQTAYGVKLGNQWTARQLERVMKGDDTIEGVASRLREISMREYQGWASQLASGQTIQDIAEPYIQRMADLLELNPADVEVFDNKIQAALKQTTKDGKPAAMSLSAFADEVRKDKRWQYTDNAREQVSGITADLLRQFGLLA